MKYNLSADILNTSYVAVNGMVIISLFYNYCVYSFSFCFKLDFEWNTEEGYES